MLRLNAELPEHQAALQSAARAGVRLFDLGAWEVARTRLHALDAAFSTPDLAANRDPIRCLLRLELGEASRFSAPEAWLPLFGTLPPAFLARCEWTILIADPEFKLTEFAGDHAKLYARLRQDFEALEKLANQDRIHGFGVASAAFTYPKDDPQYLSLESLLTGEVGTAEESAEKPEERKSRYTHFRAVEFPFNLFESAAFLFANQSFGNDTVSLIEAAKAYGLETFSRRPLDALTDTQLIRLVSYPDHHRVDLQAAVSRTLEVALTRESALGLSEKIAPWAHRLRDQLKHVNDPQQWKEILARRIRPDLEPLRHSDGAQTRGYLEAMEALLLAVQLWCEKRAAERNERIRAKIVTAAPALREMRGGKPATLSATAFRVYRSVPGLDGVLLGMRSIAAVEEATRIFASEPGSDSDLNAAFYAAHEAIHAALSPEPPNGPQKDSPHEPLSH